MEDLRTQAHLVDFESAGTGAGAIGTVLTRAEVAETTARGEFPATLLLDLDLVEAGEGGEATAHARVAVDWDEETLEQLLASTDEPEIALWFDEAGLAEAFEEVETHGLREKAAVLAVAAAATGVAAAPSFGAVYAGGGGGSSGSSSSSPHRAFLLPTGAERPLQHDGSGPRAGAVVQPTGAERGLQQDEQIVVTPTQSPSGGPSAVTSTGDGTGLSTGEVAGVAAGAALLISAAGFGVARKRQPPALPA